MKSLRFKLCKMVLERFTVIHEDWMLGTRMQEVKIIRLKDIESMCAFFGVDYWQMYRTIHEDYIIR